MGEIYIKPTPVHGFHFWCQKVIPLVFDDSLSYYEVLCKLTDYMNQFATSLNQTIEGLEQLQLFFEAYKDEINGELDIINEKINELEAGYSLTLPFSIFENPQVGQTKSIQDVCVDDFIDIINDMLNKNAYSPISITVNELVPPLNMMPDILSCISDIKTAATNHDTLVFCTQLKSLSPLDYSYGDNYFYYSLELSPDEYTYDGTTIISTNHTMNYSYYETSYISATGRNTSYEATSDYQPANVKYVKDYVEEHGGTGGLPLLEVENINAQADGTLTTEETTKLNDIINDMLKNQLVTPIALAYHIDGISYSDNAFQHTCILTSGQGWMSSVLEGVYSNIIFEGYAYTEDTNNGVSDIKFKITIPNDKYTIYANNTIDIDTNYPIKIELEGKTYLPTEGTAISYVPTIDPQPVNKEYVDKNNALTKTVLIENIYSMTQFEIDWLQDYLNQCIEDNYAYTLKIITETTVGSNDSTELYFDWKDFIGMRNVIVNSAGNGNIYLLRHVISNYNSWGFGTLEISVDYDSTATPKVSIVGINPNIAYEQIPLYTDIEAQMNQRVKSIQYEGSTWLFDASNPRSLTLNVDMGFYNIPSGEWQTVGIKHMWYDENDGTFIEDTTNTFYVENGFIKGSYALSSSDFTDGYGYRDVLILDFIKTTETEYGAWLN